MEHGVHTSHPAIIKRLKNAEGHIRGIVTMLEEGRNCLDRAVGAGGQAARVPIEEFKAITKYL
jgi:hypothetical protein